MIERTQTLSKPSVSDSGISKSVIAGDGNCVVPIWPVYIWVPGADSIEDKISRT